MTKLETLINELCPNGVEYIKIEDITSYEQPTPYIVHSTDYDDNYDIPVLTAGQTFILGYTNETDNIYPASKENPVIIFDDFTGSFKWVDFPFKVKSSAMKIIKAKSNIATLRYIYHIMGYLNFSSDEHKRLWISIYSQFQIPLPPLEIQEEIVRILDNFTELTAELEAELEARKKQYEYYRDELLTFGDDVPKVKLGDIAPLARGTRVIKKQLQSTGTYPVFQNSLTSMGFYHTGNRKANTTFVICAGAAGEIGYSYNEFWAADDCFTFECSEQIISRFLYYALQMQQHILFSRVRKASIPRISRDSIESIAIPVPSLSEQERIVSILDHFDKLCNDITEGLPAEIEARQKQYEYYRDKLLSFKEMS